MRAVSESLCTAEVVDIADIARLPDLLLVRASTAEDRSTETVDNAFSACSVWVLDNEVSNDDIIVFRTKSDSNTISLRSMSSKCEFQREIERRTVVIDITGFEHSHWAWLVRAALESTANNVSALYVEPKSYTFSDQPVGGEYFDLSEKIRGINPLPGFARILPKRGASVFVPLLGFEGPRLTYMIEQVEPNGMLTYPVIGVPGFQADFPFFTINGNRRALLKEPRIWGNRRYARANCPGSAYSVLKEIRAEHPDKVMKIAPIGTTPHALGAVLFKYHFDDSVDLIYDHPIRNPRRTSGASNHLLYNLNRYRSKP